MFSCSAFGQKWLIHFILRCFSLYCFARRNQQTRWTITVQCLKEKGLRKKLCSNRQCVQSFSCAVQFLHVNSQLCVSDTREWHDQNKSICLSLTDATSWGLMVLITVRWEGIKGRVARTQLLGRLISTCNKSFRHLCKKQSHCLCDCVCVCYCRETVSFSL